MVAPGCVWISSLIKSVSKNINKQHKNVKYKMGLWDGSLKGKSAHGTSLTYLSVIPRTYDREPTPKSVPLPHAHGDMYVPSHTHTHSNNNK